MKGKTDLYQRLNISRDASLEEIRKAYRRISKQVHPDVNQTPGATELFLDIQDAYKTLSNPQRRAQYDHQYPIPQDPPPPSLDTIITYSAGALLRLNEPQRIYSLIELTPTSAHQFSKIHLPLHVGLVLDLSTSMKGTRLDTLKSATIDLIEELESDDLLSIITFNDRANVLFSAYSPIKKNILEAKIRGLTAQGGTEIYQGLKAAYDEIVSQDNKDRVNHIILITDGHTYGDEEDCLQLAQKALDLDIGISGFGIGSEWNDDFLDVITSRTGGSIVYIRRSKDVQQFLKWKVNHLTQAYAKNVILDLNPSPKVSLRSSLRLTPEANPLPMNPPFSLGSLRQNGVLQVLLEFLVDPIPADIDQVGLATGEFTIRLKHQTQFIPITLRRSVVPADTRLDPPPANFLDAMFQLTLYQMHQNAYEQLERGNTEAAYKKMEHLATRLLEREEHSLAETAFQELKNIKSHHNVSSQGRKTLKYGTRKLLLLPRRTMRGER